MPKTAITASPMNFSTVPPCRSIAGLHGVEEPRHDAPEGLGVEPLAEGGGAGHVAEQDGDGLADLGRAVAAAASRGAPQNWQNANSSELSRPQEPQMTIAGPSLGTLFAKSTGLKQKFLITDRGHGSGRQPPRSFPDR